MTALTAWIGVTLILEESRYLKNIALTTALGPALGVSVIVTWPEIFQIR